jgi:hypothetical protein
MQLVGHPLTQILAGLVLKGNTDGRIRKIMRDDLLCKFSFKKRSPVAVKESQSIDIV